MIYEVQRLTTSKDAGWSMFQLSLTVDGSALPLTTNGSGNLKGWTIYG
jgi:hypothetical protein